MKIFPQTELSDTEKHIVYNALKEPAVQKYLHMLAYGVGTGITLATNREGEADEQFLRRLAQAQGQLAVIETLLQTGSQEVEQTPVNS